MKYVKYKIKCLGFSKRFKKLKNFTETVSFSLDFPPPPQSLLRSTPLEQLKRHYHYFLSSFRVRLLWNNHWWPTEVQVPTGFAVFLKSITQKLIFKCQFMFKSIEKTPIYQQSDAMNISMLFELHESFYTNSWFQMEILKEFLLCSFDEHAVVTANKYKTRAFFCNPW